MTAGRAYFLGCVIAALLIFVWILLAGTAHGGTARALDGRLYEVTTEYQGRTLHCLIRDGDGYGVGSGMSCDFIRFYRRAR